MMTQQGCKAKYNQREFCYRGTKTGKVWTKMSSMVEPSSLSVLPHAAINPAKWCEFAAFALKHEHTNFLRQLVDRCPLDSLSDGHQTDATAVISSTSSTIPSSLHTDGCKHRLQGLYNICWIMCRIYSQNEQLTKNQQKVKAEKSAKSRMCISGNSKRIYESSDDDNDDFDDVTNQCDILLDSLDNILYKMTHICDKNALTVNLLDDSNQQLVKQLFDLIYEVKLQAVLHASSASAPLASLSIEKEKKEKIENIISTLNMSNDEKNATRDSLWRGGYYCCYCRC